MDVVLFVPGVVRRGNRMLARRRQIFEVIVTPGPLDEVGFVVTVKRPSGVVVLAEVQKGGEEGIVCGFDRYKNAITAPFDLIDDMKFEKEAGKKQARGGSRGSLLRYLH